MRMRDEDGHHAMLEASKAWRRIKTGQVRLWSDWTLVVGPGLIKARAEAMWIAQTNVPMGRGYNTAMSGLLAEYKLDDMGETSRAHLLKVMENLAAVEEWRAKQKDPGDLNHPSRVWMKYQRSAKAQDEHVAEKVKRRRSAAKETEGGLAAALERIAELEEERKSGPAPLTVEQHIAALITLLADASEDERRRVFEDIAKRLGLPRKQKRQGRKETPPVEKPVKTKRKRSIKTIERDVGLGIKVRMPVETKE